MNDSSNQAPSKRPKKSNIWQVLQSVLAAFFGVQTKAKFDHDAGQTDYKAYLIVGLIMTILFVISLSYFVRWLVADISADL